MLVALVAGTSACGSELFTTSKSVANPDRKGSGHNGPKAPTPANVSSSARAGDEIGKITIGGEQRTYLLHTPKSYRGNQPLPLVLAFHGYGSQGKDLARATGFSNLADQQGFFVVYPDGLEKRWNVLDSGFGGVDDAAFVSALIEHLTQIRALDPRRIYAAGVSNGGFWCSDWPANPPIKVPPIKSLRLPRLLRRCQQR